MPGVWVVHGSCLVVVVALLAWPLLTDRLRRPRLLDATSA
jgi:hypothetical protein